MKKTATKSRTKTPVAAKKSATRRMSRSGRARKGTSVPSFKVIARVLIILGLGIGAIIGGRRVCALIGSRVAQSQRLEHVEICTSGTLDRGQVLTLVRLPKNISLGHIDVRRCQARLLQCPQILEAHVERVYPNVLRVKLVERVPAFKLRSGAGWAFVSPDGVIFEGRGIPETTTQRLPQLEGTFTGSATLSFLPELYRAFAAFQRKSPAIVETWKSIEVDEKAYATMGYLDGFTVKSNPIHRLVLCTGDPQRQLEELKYVLAEAQARRQLPLERVDLSIPGRAYVTPRRGP